MPTNMDDQQAAKAAAGRAVAELIQDGMYVGVGTGSTASKAIEAIGARIRVEGLVIHGVPTSFASERLARQNGFVITTLDDVETLDLAFDGADEVDPDLQLIKGRGAAQTREKIVAKASREFIVLVDESKIVTQLGSVSPVAIEFVPLAYGPIMRLVLSLGGRPELRMGRAKDGPVVSDQGLWIIDARFSGIENPHQLSDSLSNEPGILDHGIFLDLTTSVLIGQADGTVKRITKDQS